MHEVTAFSPALMVASPEAVLLLSCRTVQPKDIAPQDLVLVDPKESPSDRPKEQASPVVSNDAFHFQHIPELDGFRGLAILLVVVGRYWEFHGSSSVRNLAQSIAHLGVLLFFVLSGFLITGLLYRERSLTGSISFKRFYIRRALRLLPAFFLFLFTVALLVKLGNVTDVPKIEFLECLLYLRNIFGHSLSLGHIWSLSLEEQFYLVWPLTFFLLPPKRAPAVVAWVCLAFMIWRGLAIAFRLFSYEHGIFYVRPYFRFDSILIGCLIALWLCSSATAHKRLKSFAQHSWSPALWITLFLWATIGERFSRTLHITISEILVAMVLSHVVLRADSLAARIFRARWLRYGGVISYSLYLWQDLFISPEPPSWGLLREPPLAFILPIAIAVASYHLMERPILRLKNRLAPEARSAEL
jgi:peptidoglycan/LPS O-acetylase OafA/YrhL